MRALFLILVSSLLLGGCECGSNPNDDLFSSLWPNGDGSSWTYRYMLHTAANTGGVIEPLEGLNVEYASAADPADLDARLTLPFPATAADEAFAESATITLAFHGTAMSPDGPKQNLECTRVEGGKKAGAAEPILARIHRARPDLRERMAELGMIPAWTGKNLDVSTTGPLFVDGHGGKFEKQAEWMGYYGDVSADSSYTIVRAPIATGGAFRHQLVPSLSDDLWEYGWIAGWGDVVTDAGTFQAVRVVYLFDFGEAELIDEDGDVIATYHPHSLALLALAPDVGPVYQRGFDYFLPENSQTGEEEVYLFHEMSLIDYDLR